MKKINFELLTGLGHVLETTTNIVQPTNVVYSQKSNLTQNDQNRVISTSIAQPVVFEYNQNSLSLDNANLLTSPILVTDKQTVISKVQNYSKSLEEKKQVTQKFVEERYSKYFDNKSILGFDKDYILQGIFEPKLTEEINLNIRNETNWNSFENYDDLLKDKINTTDFLLNTADFASKNIKKISFAKENNYLDNDDNFIELVEKSFVYSLIKTEKYSFENAKNQFEIQKTNIISKKELLKNEMKKILSKENSDLNDLFKQIQTTNLNFLDEASSKKFLNTQFKSKEFSNLKTQINQLRNQINNINYYKAEQGALIQKFQKEIQEKLLIKFLLNLGSLAIGFTGVASNLLPAAGPLVSAVLIGGSLLLVALTEKVQSQIDSLTNKRDFLIENNKLLLDLEKDYKNFFSYISGEFDNFLSAFLNKANLINKQIQVGQALETLPEIGKPLNKIKKALLQNKNIFKTFQKQSLEIKKIFDSKALKFSKAFSKVVGKFSFIADSISSINALSLIADASKVQADITSIFSKNSNLIGVLENKIESLSSKLLSDFAQMLLKNEIINLTNRLKVFEESPLSTHNSDSFLTLSLEVSNLYNIIKTSSDSYSTKSSWSWKNEPKSGYLGADKTFYIYDHNWWIFRYGSEQERDNGSFANFSEILLETSDLNLFDNTSLVFKSDGQFRKGFELFDNSTKNKIKNKIKEVIAKWSLNLNHAETNIVFDSLKIKVNFQTKNDSYKNLIVEYFDINIELKIKSTYMEVII